MITYSVWYQTTIAFFYDTLLPTHVNTHSYKHRHAVLERVHSTHSLVIYRLKASGDLFFILFSLTFFPPSINSGAKAEDFGLAASLYYPKKKEQKTKARTGRSTSSHTPNAPDGLLLWHVTPFFLPLVLTLVLSLSRSCHLFSSHVTLVSVSTVWLLRYLFLDSMLTSQSEAEIISMHRIVTAFSLSIACLMIRLYSKHTNVCIFTSNLWRMLRFIYIYIASCQATLMINAKLSYRQTEMACFWIFISSLKKKK